jgi:fatty acid amide hydrolase
LISCFKTSGAIPFVRSCVPQFGMAPETVSRVWGRALNPWNRDRTVGGSSGGEAGLIASRCSVLGFGSDIGGSIRIPA